MIRLPFIRLSVTLLQLGLVSDPQPSCQHEEDEGSSGPLTIGFTSHLAEDDE